MDQAEGNIDASESELPNVSLHHFLDTSPWWVGRDDTGVVWDGQSAFVAAPPSNKLDIGDNEASNDSSHPKPRRRSVRSLLKKDLCAAWSAMMRTPRFIRRKLLTRSQSGSAVDGSTTPDTSTSAYQIPSTIDAPTGERLVWRRFKDLLSDVANQADAKRLGEQHFLQYCGEFRHYYAEKHAYNTHNRLPVDGL